MRDDMSKAKKVKQKSKTFLNSFDFLGTKKGRVVVIPDVSIMNSFYNR